ncbi:MAG TPA: response regulator [Verrucomicrobiae bacterium]|nr:response regulator [Verrucomicrobiae bacterium]
MSVAQTVFIVDDEPAVGKAVSRLLRACGYTAQVFGSAQEFMDSYKPGTSGCLVADFSMPGMNGLELQRWLADSGLSLPILFVTGLDDIPEAVRTMMMEGALDILTKPVNPGELLEAVQKALALNQEIAKS